MNLQANEATAAAPLSPDPKLALPLVSILMPCYKHPDYIAPAIESCLAQSYTNVELICVDDNSPDNLWEVLSAYAARDPRVRIFRHSRNQGPAQAFQTALHHSAGSLVTRLACDDIFFPDAVEAMASEFQKAPEAGLVYGDMMQIDRNGQPMYEMITNEPETALWPCNRLGLCAMWRREVHEKAGGFACGHNAEDYDLWLRISLFYPLHKLHGHPLLGFRRHGMQGSRDEKKLALSATRAQLHYFQTQSRLHPWSLAPRLRVVKSTIRQALIAMNLIAVDEPLPEV